MNFERSYNMYKKLPFIYAGISLFLTLVWTIIDYEEGFTDIGEFIIPWILIGSAISVGVFFITKIRIAPTVVRTDAVLSIKGYIRNYVNQK